MRPPITLAAILRLSLYYGIAGFGGGYSVLAQLKHEIVERREWLSEDDFLVLAEVSKSLPGTAATSLIALLGQRVAGARAGLLAAGAFLLPSMILMSVCAAAYSLVRAATGLSIFFDGMNAAMVGVVGAVTVDLGRSALRGKRDVLFAFVCGLLLVARVIAEPVLAAATVAIGVLRGRITARARKQSPPGAESDHAPASERLHGLAPLFVLPVVLTGSLALLAGLVRVFVPIGVTTFGGGLAMIPAIDHMVVIQRGWLGPKAFADAIALGQITPGPVAICATFIGYRVAGIAGAIVATLAMFGPATGLALVVGHSVERFRSSPIVEGVLRTLAPAVIGMLGAAAFSLGRAAIGMPIDIGIAVASFAVLVSWPVSPMWLLVGGGLARVAG
ncbi:MAG: chromate efflux transporter, partial [Polyangiaceae bacterium]